jgi:hypothetical protein
MRIAIVGKGTGWKEAPIDNEIWGVNDLCVRRDVDVIFNMHKPCNGSRWNVSVEYANKYNTPFITLEELPNVPTSIRFPIEEMHTNYFGCSISFMIAYAIYKGVTQIDLYGCTLWGGTEYTQQKPNVEYWIGYARGLGIKTIVHGVSNLLKSHNGLIYGYLTKQE